MYKIDKNIPMPAKRNVWSFLEGMKVGESVFVPGVKPSLLSAASRFYGRFRVRATTEKGVAGARGWRVS